MAKDRRKLQHIHSSIPDKQPTAASLEVAEIAVNNAADKEFLSIKNTNDKVVRFSSDGQIIEWIERKEVMPYVGYVRGAAGPSATSGDTPTADGYGSYGIENTDLLNNKSELVFKLNQVAADLTTKHDKVNGKKDMYNKDVNPTTDGGINDGAGFFIDMSRYAMQDANPQFSSTTNTCRTTLSGTTIIRGLDGDCGSLLDIVVDSASTKVKTATTEATSAHTTVGNATTIVSGNTSLFVSGATTEEKKGNVTETNLADKIENTSGNTILNTVHTLVKYTSGGTVTYTTGSTVEEKRGSVIENTTGNTNVNRQGNLTATITGTTTEIKNGDVTENNLSAKTENTSGNFTVNTSGNVVTNTTGTTTEIKNGDVTENNRSNKTENTIGNRTENTVGDVLMTSTGDTCITSFADASFYGSANTKVGVSCSGDVTTRAEIQGEDVVINATTNNVGITAKNEIDVSAEGSINITANDSICETAGDKASFYGVAETNLGLNCDNSSSSTTTNIYGETINTQANSAYTSANTATTIIDTANASATTATLSGSTLTVNENRTTINSCSKVEINTDYFTLSQCSSGGGSAEFEFCNGYTVKSNDVKIQHCDGATSSSISIKEKTIEISGGTITETSTGNTTINASGNTNINTKGDVALTTSGSTTINSTGSTTIQSTGNGSDVCITAADVAALKGTTKTNIGKDCSDGGQTTTLNLNGTTINETGTTVNVSGSTSTNISGGTVNVSGGTVNSSSANETCITAGTTAALVGATKTNIGKNCADGGQTTTLNINGTTINETGNTVNVSATTNVNISADTICESAKTEADFYAPKTQIGVSCNGSTATTVNISGTTINEGGTNLNQNVTNYDLNGAVICISGSTNSNFYGKETNIGVDCGGTTATTVNVSGTTINEGGTTNNNTFTTVNNTATTINNSTTDYNINTTNYDLNGSVICISGSTNTDIYGKETNIGVDCGGTTATTVNVSGTTINEGGTTNNNTFTTVNNTATTINNSTTTYNITGTSNVNVYGGDVCISGGTEASLGAKTVKIGTDCGTNTIATGITINATTSVTVNAPTTIITGDTYISGDTTIGGDTFISGDTTVDGDLIINIPCDSITSTTVNDALCEIMGRGAVTMTRDSSPSDTRLSAVYKLYQNGSQIGYDINVPKDGFLKSVELINDGNTYYLRFTWYIYDADTQTYTTGSTDVNIEDLVKDIDENNSKTDRGVNVDVWYNETAKKMNVSADTTVTIKNNGGSGTKTFTKSAGTHTLTAYTLSYTHNGFTGSFDPFEANSSFTSPHSALTVNYGGSICNSSSTVTYNTSADKSITIPTKVNDIKRSILKWDYGSVSAKSASDYDPGSYTGAGCTGDATNSITIPKSIDHLTNWNGTCISLPHDTCITGKLEVSNGVYNTSDERLKSDIKRVEYPQMLEARKVGIKQFYYNSDPSKRVTYGVIAQDVQAHNLNEMVYEDEGGFLSVDYTSLMILKIAYLENEVERLTHILGEISDKIK